MEHRKEKKSITLCISTCIFNIKVNIAHHKPKTESVTGDSFTCFRGADESTPWTPESFSGCFTKCILYFSLHYWFQSQLQKSSRLNKNTTMRSALWHSAYLASIQAHIAYSGEGFYLLISSTTRLALLVASLKVS